MQFKIPQDVQRPDTIVGPITFKQLAILLVGGGLTYATFLILEKIYFWYVWIFPVAFLGLLTLAVAFLKIHDMTFTRYMSYLAEFFFKPRERHWSKGDMAYYHSVLKPITPIKKEADVEETYADELIEKKKKLEELTEKLNQ